MAWCDSESEIIFCASGSWYLLACDAFADGAFCGLDEESDTIDCFVEVEEESEE